MYAPVVESERWKLLSYPVFCRRAWCWSTLDKTVRGVLGGRWGWWRGVKPLPIHSHVFFNVCIVPRLVKTHALITNDRQSGSFLISVISLARPSRTCSSFSYVPPATSDNFSVMTKIKCDRYNIIHVNGNYIKIILLFVLVMFCLIFKKLLS